MYPHLTKFYYKIAIFNDTNCLSSDKIKLGKCLIS